MRFILNDFYGAGLPRQSYEGEIDMQHHTNACRKLLTLCLSLLVMSLACGCSHLSRNTTQETFDQNPSNPFHDIKKVAVTPFATDEAAQNVPLDRSLSYAGALASELAQFPGFEVVRAYRQPSAPPQSGHSPTADKVTGQESEELAKDLDVDAVIIGSITEYDPYTPRIGITLTLIRTRATPASQAKAPKFADLELLAQTGQPIVIKQKETGEVLAVRVEKIFDSRQDAVKDAIKRYAVTRSGNNSPAGEDQFLRESNYIQFVSNMMIRELLKAATSKEKEKGGIDAGYSASMP